MPIDIDSDEWDNAERYDSIKVHIHDLLSRNDDQAFSIEEIDEHLCDNHHYAFPGRLVEPGAIEGAKAARQSIIASILDLSYWYLDVSFRYIQGSNDEEQGIYFTWKGDGIHPIAEIDEVSDPDPDSPWGKLSGRFRKIESDHDEDVSGLEERIAHLEYRVQEELGLY